MFQNFPGPYISVKEKKLYKHHNNVEFSWLRPASRSSLSLDRHLRIAFWGEKVGTIHILKISRTCHLWCRSANWANQEQLNGCLQPAELRISPEKSAVYISQGNVTAEFIDNASPIHSSSDCKNENIFFILRVFRMLAFLKERRWSKNYR